jgi:TonB family protein
LQTAPIAADRLSPPANINALRRSGRYHTEQAILRTERFIFIATCASLLLHAGALEFAKHEADYPRVYLGPARHAATVVIALQPLPKPSLKPPVQPDEDMGDRKGTGTATASSDGNQPLQARKADQDQPALQRDPSGPGKIGHATVAADAPVGERGHGGQRGQITLNTTPEPAAPEKAAPPQPLTAQVPAPAPAALMPPPAPKEQPPKPETPQPPAPAFVAQVPPTPPTKVKTILVAPDVQPPAAPTPTPPATAPAVRVAVAPPPTPQTPTPPTPPKAATPPARPPTPATPKARPTVAVQVATGDGLAPGHASEADPFQQSDSESDAFTTTGSAVMHDGRISVRAGRKIKTTRPQLLVPGLLDTLGVSDPTLQLKIHVDTTGTVTLVNVVRSSGSNDIDQPCVVAVYDWWFEPRVDNKGKPIADVVDFTISFR